MFQDQSFQDEKILYDGAGARGQIDRNPNARLLKDRHWFESMVIQGLSNPSEEFTMMPEYRTL